MVWIMIECCVHDEVQLPADDSIMPLRYEGNGEWSVDVSNLWCPTAGPNHEYLIEMYQGDESYAFLYSAEEIDKDAEAECGT